MCCGPCNSVGPRPTSAPRAQSFSASATPVSSKPVDLGVQKQVEQTQARAEKEQRRTLFGDLFQDYRRPLVAI